MFCTWFSFYYKNIKRHDFLLRISQWVGAQLFQSWNLKQSLAIFQTGWSLLGVAWAVNRKFWLKKRSLFPSNFTVPPVTTSRVVWPWVACSVKEAIDSCMVSPFGLHEKQLDSSSSCIIEITFEWLCFTNHEQADNRLCELGIHLMAMTRKTLPGHPVLRRRSHSTPAWPCPGRVGSSSKTGDPLRS